MDLRIRTHRRAFLGGVATALVGGWTRARAARAADPAAPDVVTAVTSIRGLEGRERELEAHLLSLAAPTRAEPGCLQYDLYRSPEHASQFLRLEVWRSLADLEAHKATPHIRASFAKRQAEGWTTEITVWKRVPG